MEGVSVDHLQQHLTHQHIHHCFLHLLHSPTLLLQPPPLHLISHKSFDKLSHRSIYNLLPNLPSAHPLNLPLHNLLDKGLHDLLIHYVLLHYLLESELLYHLIDDLSGEVVLNSVEVGGEELVEDKLFRDVEAVVVYGGAGG